MYMHLSDQALRQWRLSFRWGHQARRLKLDNVKTIMMHNAARHRSSPDPAAGFVHTRMRAIVLSPQNSLPGVLGDIPKAGERVAGAVIIMLLLPSAKNTQ